MTRASVRRLKAAAAVLLGTAALFAALTASAQAIRAHGLPSQARQIAALKKAEARIGDLIKALGVDHASYGDIPLGDLRSFNVEPLWNSGVDGAGTTVAVIEGWNYPGLNAYIARWDRYVDLPNASIKTIYPAGALPKRCPPGMVARKSYGSCAGWQGELLLDVEAVHLFAPYARIVVSVTPARSDDRRDDSAQVAPPEMMKAVGYLAAKHIANVISISDGSDETGYRYGHAEIRAQDPGLLTAAAHGVPVTNATGDCGAAQELPSGNGFCNRLTKVAAAATWADSPFVTAVGGVTPAFKYDGPGGQDSFSVWRIDHGFAAENAGLSRVYKRPAYQDGVAATIGARWRAVPDITMDSQDGTSQAAPEFAGVLALATQMRHHDLGPINQLLYRDLGPAGAADGIVDVTKGNDSGHGLKGYAAGPGYDIASGWGTVNADLFVPALATAASHQHGFGPLAAEAADQLAALRSAGHVKPASVAAGGKLSVTSRGFLPEHRVTVTVDRRRVTSVRADRHGNLKFRLALKSLQLAPGTHTLRLSGLLLTQTLAFSVGVPSAMTARDWWRQIPSSS